MRSIEELASLIQRARAAEEQAERPHLLSAGEKLLEARSQFTHEAEFKNWVRHNFPGQIRLAHRSLQMAIEHNAQASRELEAARVAGYTA
jgi:hypothetical protein